VKEPVYPTSLLVCHKAQMRDAIRKERRVELASRTCVISTHAGGRLRADGWSQFFGMNINAGTSLTDPSFFNGLLSRTEYSRRGIFWPIPQQELNVDKQLVQIPVGNTRV